MTPLELFEEARLADALAAQRAVVDAHPEDVAEALLLCDFLGFAGRHEELVPLLDKVGSMQLELDDYLCEWLEAIAADQARHKQTPPRFFRSPSAAVHARLTAYVRLRDGLADEAMELIDNADETEHGVGGFVDGRAFDGWRDSDELLGDCLEAFWKGAYYWVPFQQIRKLRLDQAQSLRDALYAPATAQLYDGSEWELFLPVLYAQSATHAEEGIRTGAGVDWVDAGGVVRAVGERTFLFGDEELGISEFRQVEIKPV